MAANISGLHQFADDVGPLPLKLLDDSYSTLSIALNTLSTFSNFYQDQGTTNAYTIQTTQYQFASYTDGLQVTVRIANTNTGMSTLNVNGLGAKHILTAIGTELQPNALVAGSMVTFIFNAQRDAWQISDSGASGQITAPLHITNATGQAALSINPDGTGYLGDFNGNGLSWDGACNFTFEGGATLSGIKLPFSVSDGNYDFFNMQVPADPPGYLGDCVVSIAPVGTHADQVILCLNGATNGPAVLRVSGSRQSQPDCWVGVFTAEGYWPEAPPTWTPPPAGTAFGVKIDCGTTATDTALWVRSSGTEVSPGVESNTEYFIIRGDGSGRIGSAPNQLVWDTAGHFTLTGTATLPMPPLIDLPGITITNPQNGEALVYDQATNSWVNGAPVNALATLNDVNITSPFNGQSLIYNSTSQRWVNSAAVLTLEQLTNTHISGVVSGQVLTYSTNPQPGWVNATIPGYNFLTNLGVGPNPQAGWVLTWDGQAWVGAAPGQVAQFPLSSLTDVGITTPLNRQVLTYDAPSAKWINAPAPSPSLATLPDVALTSQTQGQVLAWNATANRWENSSLPGGSVIALDTLMDTNISDPQNFQVLRWDFASARWVNGWYSFSNLAGLNFTNLTNGQVLSYNAATTQWVNTTLPPTPALSTLPDVAITALTGGQMLVYNAGATRWVNSQTLSPTSGTALTLNAPTAAVAFIANSQIGAIGVLNSTFANGGYLTWSVNGTAIGDIGSSLGNIGSGTPTDMAINARGNNSLYLATGNVPHVAISGDGSGTLGASAPNLLKWNSSGDWVLGRDFTTQTVRLWLQSAPGGHGLYLQAGSTGTTGLPFAVWNQDNSVGYFSVRDDGMIGMLAGALRMYPFPVAAGNAVVDLNCGANIANGGNALRLWGGLNSNVLYIQGATNTSGPYSGLTVVQPGNADYSYGITIQAGSSGTDYSLSARTYSGAQVILEARGDRSVCLPGINSNVAAGTYQAVQWWAGGFGSIVATSSSIRYKRNVRSLTRSRAREILSKLRAVTFRQTAKEAPDIPCYGFIAEEVAEVDRSLCPVDAEGNPAGVSDERIVALLVPLIQELLGMDEPEGEVYG